MIIHLLRHAETVLNRFHQDVIDCDLTEQGIEQAKQLVMEYDYIICSPLKRTKDTLKYSNIRYKNIEYNHLCREYRNHLADFIEGEEIKFETVAEIKERVSKFKSYLRSLNANNILIVSHRDFIYHFTDENIQPANVQLVKWKI